MAVHYHMDMKHNTYWELEVKVRDTLIKEKNSSEAEYEEDKSQTKSDFCEKSLQNKKGLIVHMSRMHKEEYWLTCKESQEVPTKCYIYVGSSEDAFKVHSEKNLSNKKAKEHHIEVMDM